MYILKVQKGFYLLEFIDLKENILKKNNREDNGKKTEYKDIALMTKSN